MTNRIAGAIHKNDSDARKAMNEVERLAMDLFSRHQSHGYVWAGWHSCPSWPGDSWPQHSVSFAITGGQNKYKVTIELDEG